MMKWLLAIPARYHLDCVGESPGVANRQFVCPKCTGKKEKRARKGKAEANVPRVDKSLVPKRPTSTESGGSTDQVPTNLMVACDLEPIECESQIGKTSGIATANVEGEIETTGAIGGHSTESSMQRELRR